MRLTRRCLFDEILVLLVLSGGCAGARQSVTDPIVGVPTTQQRTITRHQFTFRWPFVVGVGTLGCTSGAVVFRANGVSYALNDTAQAKGFPELTLPRVTVDPGPRHPLGRLKQELRTKIFAAARACRPREAERTCRQQLRDRYALSEEELTQVEAEGEERHWPPLPPEYRRVAPLVEAGLELCSP